MRTIPLHKMKKRGYFHFNGQVYYLHSMPSEGMITAKCIANVPGDDLVRVVSKPYDVDFHDDCPVQPITLKMVELPVE